MIRKQLQKFIGEIEQTVPAFSAIKRNGEKLYNLARAGKNIGELPRREVSVTSFKLLSFWKKHEVALANFEIECSSGTYIRSLIHDLGRELGTCATTTQLRRTAIDTFSVTQAFNLNLLF